MTKNKTKKQERLMLQAQRRKEGAMRSLSSAIRKAVEPLDAAGAEYRQAVKESKLVCGRKNPEPSQEIDWAIVFDHDRPTSEGGKRRILDAQVQYLRKIWLASTWFEGFARSIPGGADRHGNPTSKARYWDAHFASIYKRVPLDEITTDRDLQGDYIRRLWGKGQSTLSHLSENG